MLAEINIIESNIIEKLFIPIILIIIEICFIFKPKSNIKNENSKNSKYIGIFSENQNKIKNEAKDLSFCLFGKIDIK